jgi:Mlc titration factor MtfA (ptsG expression regulator)
MLAGLLMLRDSDFETKLIIILGITAFVIVFSNYGFRMVEMIYVMRKKKPLYVHRYWRLKKLNEEQRAILQERFAFYKKLTAREKVFFEHRLVLFIKDKDFIGRRGLSITNEVKILTSATAIMLTFGFRDFYIGIVEKIIMYPEAFFSKMNNEYHKGEFNPKLKAIVLSWQDLKEGYKDPHDNVNLGIHEFTHAIHINGIKARDVSSNIFQDGFKELTAILAANRDIKQKLVDSEYFRSYAFTNQFEFLAVIIETFIESPDEFRNQFPLVYGKVRQMLNYNFAGY